MNSLMYGNTWVERQQVIQNAGGNLLTCVNATGSTTLTEHSAASWPLGRGVGWGWKCFCASGLSGLHRRGHDSS
jgi:hypothetical protein